MIRTIWRLLTTDEFRGRVSRVRKALDVNFPMILGPTIAEDGIISQHLANFLTDPKFDAAYKVAREEVNWGHPTEIKFRAYTACWAASHAMTIEGDFVECGVAHGVLSRAVCEYVDFSKSGKTFYLYDTFKGIPIETLVSEKEKDLATRYNKSHYSEDFIPLVTKRFKSFNNVKIIPGILPNSLNEKSPEKISYLSIDLNNAPAEMGVINELWDKLTPGALVLLDDYAYGNEFIEQKNAWDEFSLSKGKEVLTMATGQGLLIK